MVVMLSDCMQSASMYSGSMSSGSMSCDSMLSESDCMLSHRMMSDRILSDLNSTSRQYAVCIESGSKKSDCSREEKMRYDKANSAYD